MDDPSLKDLEIFVAVAGARSFRGAAAKRRVSPSSLSDAVRRLEARLQTRLLNRTTRSVTPTEAGRRLIERVSPALDELTDALDTLGGELGEPAGTLRLNVPFVVADTILAPIAARFLAAHPRIKLEVTADNNFVDVLAAGFDAGIRYEERVERDMIAVPIGPRRQRFVLAAAPAYIEARGMPAHPRDLVDHACVRFRFASGIVAPWEFERGSEIVKVEPHGALIATSIALLLEFACAGGGIVFMFEDYLREAMHGRRLLPLLEEWWPSFSGPFLYYPSRTRNPPALRAFLAFIKGG